MAPRHADRRIQVLVAHHPLASAFALGGLVSLVWVGVAGLVAWNSLSTGAASVLASVL
jgi:hypothetical protein